jgi:integrase
MQLIEERLLDAAGRPRSPATMPGYHAGRPPRNKGIRYPADPPRVEEIVSVMRREAPFRSSPASSRACRRDGSGGCAAHVIQRQLGHADLGVTSIYLQGIDNTEVISAVHSRRPPTMPASAGLLL